MALGPLTKQAGVGQSASAPVYVDLVTFPGDAAYPAGGSPGFKALVQAVTRDQREVLGVAGQDAGGFVPIYDRAADTLKMLRAGVANSPLEEVPNGIDLSGTTFHLLVFSR